MSLSDTADLLAVQGDAEPAPSDLPNAEPPYTPHGTAAAFFDLDRTLISGSSAFVLGMTAYRNGLIPKAQFARDAAAAVRFRLHGASDDTSTGVRDRILGAVRGVAVEDLVALNADIVPKLMAKLCPEAKLLLDQHRHAHRATYIVSASPVELVEPLAKALGMTGGLGTRSTIVDGIYTGELAAPFCYGPGKVEAIRELARWEGYHLDHCWAYSDSASDLPMMECVGHPVAVNPDGKLERIANERGWPVVVFSRKSKSVVRRISQGVVTAGVAAGGFAAGARYGRGRVS